MMNVGINPAALSPAALYGWVSAKIDDAVVSAHPAQLAGNMVGRICVIGVQLWILGVAIPAATYLGIGLAVAMLLVVLLAQWRQRSAVSPQEQELKRKARLERPSIISALGLRIPIRPVRQWFATAMGRRFSHKLTGIFVKFTVVCGIAVQSGAGLGVKHVLFLPLCIALAYMAAKNSQAASS